MRFKILLTLFILWMTSMPAYAARYSSGGEALFVGLLQGLFFVIVIWAYNAFKKRKKKDDEDE